jgi:uncharacterized protein (DUF1015 family)
VAQVHPFRAYRYNPAKADFARVLTQPYDKITPAMQYKYYAADAHNLIAIEKGREFPADSAADNVYTRAAASLREWMAQNVLVQDPAPAFYAYFQEYSVPGTEEKRTRTGFIGLGTLEDYEARVILPHERTHAGPKADRLRLLHHTKANTGQLFMLYADPQRRIDTILEETAAAAPPVMEVRDEYGVAHRLWPISDPAVIAHVQGVMAQQKLVIADGHHRYETAINYRNERRAQTSSFSPDAPYERTMMTFFNTHSAGLTILPTHRIVSHLPRFSWGNFRRSVSSCFQIEELPYTTEAERAAARARLLQRLRESGARRALGLSAGAATSARAYFLLTLGDAADLAKLLPGDSTLQRELDVVLLHNFIFEKVLGITPPAVLAEAHIAYERESAAALDAVDRGAAQLAFLLKPVAVEQVMRIALAGEVMPQKSTDFYPKLLSGVTIYRFEP